MWQAGSGPIQFYTPNSVLSDSAVPHSFPLPSEKMNLHLRIPPGTFDWLFTVGPRSGATEALFSLTEALFSPADLHFK
jgi:hypothetical protein